MAQPPTPERPLHRGLFTWPLTNWRNKGQDDWQPSPGHLGVDIIKNDVMTELSDMAEGTANDESFAIFDLGVVAERYWQWKKSFPNIQPFYAVKALDDPAVVSVLAHLGAGFDCASKGELEIVLGLGVSPGNIIFANTIKFPSHLVYADNTEVTLMTVDNEEELFKIRNLAPRSKLVSQRVGEIEYELKLKFGCSRTRAKGLLKLARELNLDVIGVSFHVGSGCCDANTYIEHIKMARQLFDDAELEGFQLQLLDIGGGMYGNAGAEDKLEKMSGAILDTLKELFPEKSGVRVISEPGRYFVESALIVAACVIGKMVPEDLLIDEPSKSVTRSNQETQPALGLVEQMHQTHYIQTDFEYYISESVFSVLNIGLLFAGYDYKPILLNRRPLQTETYTSRLWGPTCDSIDLVQECCHLPELEVGDWLAFRDLGSYTLAMSSPFNGFPLPTVRRVMTQRMWDQLVDKTQVCYKEEITL